MPYKVVFVEDEIVTREGIRDHVDWNGCDFEFCGEAPDGEVALQLLRTYKPDLLITDIKMPFMDGLQLCKIVREKMPWMKIVILSGHDEFEYAREAIQLGVTEYMLKPVTVLDMHNVLRKIAALLDQEKLEQEKLRRLQDQIEENQAALRERFLLKLVLGAVSSTEAFEKSQQLGLDLLARWYLVTIIRVELADRSEQFDYYEYQQIQQAFSEVVEKNPDAYLLKKDWEESVLLMKGNTPEYLEEERDVLLERMAGGIKATRYQFTIGKGAPKERITYIYQSFIEALVHIQTSVNDQKAGINGAVDKAELLKMDKNAVENYLRCGVKEGFDEFFNEFIRPLGETALRSYLIKNYIIVDVVLATARFVDELGGDIDQVVSEIKSIDTVLSNIKTVEQLREQVKKITVSALVFRDSQKTKQYTGIIQQAKQFINQHYMNPELSLDGVAAQVSLSPSHFSVIFSQETDQTFKEFLTELRIQKAKELLRMTSLGANEISIQIGYSDPHYFSYVFKKNTGMSPTEFRLQAQPG